MVKLVILLYSLVNLGDVAHVESVYNALVKEHPYIERISIDANLDNNQLLLQFNKALTQAKGNNYIILAVGEKGVASLNEISKPLVLNNPNSFVAISMHQYHKDIAKLPLDYVALPEVALLDDVSQKTIAAIPYKTLTFGVPTNNPDQEGLKKSYDNWQIANKPKIDGDYIIVTLGGDAPNENNVMRYFTTASANQLFANIYKLWQEQGKKHKVLVQNNPRTGKHNIQDGSVEYSHEYPKGKIKQLQVDYVSRHFINLLKQNSIPYEFYNFAFEIDGANKKPISVYHPLLYLALMPQKNNIFIVPGESVSMLAQIPLYLPPKQIIVFKTDSMNKSHQAILDLAFKKGYLSYFNAEGKVIHPEHPMQRELDDSVAIIRDLMKGANTKFKTLK